MFLGHFQPLILQLSESNQKYPKRSNPQNQIKRKTPKDQIENPIFNQPLNKNQNENFYPKFFCKL